MAELLDLLHQAAVNIFEPNLAKVSQIPGKRPLEFTVTILNVPKRVLTDVKQVKQYETEFADAIRSLNLEITTMTVGYERKMLRFDVVKKHS